MGTRSMILSTRPNDDDSRDGFTKWPFMTTHTWAEYPRGKWTLEVSYNDTTTILIETLLIQALLIKTILKIVYMR